MKIKNVKGITLIALVITIIVMLILAGVTISLTLGDRGILKMAEEAGKNYVQSANDEQIALNELENETDKIIESLQVPATAGTIKENPTAYYGKTITNYTGYGKESSGYGWQIYYSDGNNIYITTTDYIKTVDCPNGRNGSTPYNNVEYQPTWRDIVNDYAGSADITDEKITPWLSYLTTGASEHNNMKATTYLLDTNVWNTNFKGTKADFAIGGPTLDMFAASYKDTHPEKYVEFQSSGSGYEVKWNTDMSYKTDITELTPDESNKLYIISDATKTSYQWLASPSTTSGDNLMILECRGRVSYRSYGHDNGSVRPLVCLSSDVILKSDGTGYRIAN